MISPARKTFKSDDNPKGGEVVKFLRDLYPDGPWVITAIEPDGRPCTQTFTEPEATQKFIVRYNAEGWNIYYSPNPTRRAMNKKAKKQDIARIEYLFVDADPEEDESPQAFKARMRSQTEDFEPEPTFVVDSGNGLQFLWQLEQPIKNTGEEVIEDIEARNHALADAFGADPSTRNIDRILRVPGTINYPNEKKRGLGRTQCRARLLKVTDIYHPLAAFPPRLETRKEEAPATGRTSSELPPMLRSLLHLQSSGPYKTRSELLFAFLNGAVQQGVGDAIVAGACLDPAYTGNAIYEHCRDNKGQDYIERQIARAHTNARHGPRTAVPNHSWDDPDQSLLDDRRGDLPEFPIEAVRPEALRKWLKRAAHGSGTSIDHVVVPMLGITSSLIGTARRVQATPAWHEPHTSWTGLITYPGGGKTPAINVSRRVLDELEKELRYTTADLQREHESRVETAKVKKDQWKAALREYESEKKRSEQERIEQERIEQEQGKKKTPAKNRLIDADADESEEPTEAIDDPGEMPEDAIDPGPFIAPRLYVTDTTTEALAPQLKVRPAGMLYLVDELSGLFLNMGRYSQGTDNAFWLESHDGNPVHLVRQGRPAVDLDCSLTGVVGGFQPDMLAECFKGAADGMYARFLFSWPAKPPYRDLTQDVADIEPEIMQVLERLSKLGGYRPDKFKPRRIELSSQAVDTLNDLRRDVDAGYDALEGRERDWWSKIPRHVLRLAGTLTYLDWALSGDAANPDPEPKLIHSKYVKAAVKLVRDYFWPHARAAVRQIGQTERHANARRVLRWLKTEKRKIVSREDARRDALAQSLNADETQTLLDQLERAGWLRKTVTKPAGAGRPTIRWEVNPKLFAQDEAHA